MEKGRIVEWYIDEGQSVDEGQLLVSVETDKTVVDVNSPLGGVLLKRVAAVDGEYDVGDVLAWIGKAGEAVPICRTKRPESPIRRPAVRG